MLDFFLIEIGGVPFLRGLLVSRKQNIYIYLWFLHKNTVKEEKNVFFYR